jgi:Competence protein CoiA-like family
MADCTIRNAYQPKDQVLLEWVKVNGEQRHISAFDGWPRQVLPPVSCLICNQPLIPRWGNVRRHHFAHSPDSACLAKNMQPETALHFNAKCYIAEQLKAAARLDVREPCANLKCLSTREAFFAFGWDAVHVEYWIDPIKPDVVLLAQGRPLVALEVFVAHRVDEAKAMRLAEMGLSWAEVDADQLKLDTPEAWCAGQPLPTMTTRGWYCPECEAKKQIAIGVSVEPFEINSLPAEPNVLPPQMVTTTVPPPLEPEYEGNIIPRWFRVVDYFYTSGKKFREVFWISELRSQAQVIAMCLTAHDRQKIILRVDAPLTKERTKILDQQLERILDQRRQLKNTKVDSPMPSQKWFSAPDDSYNYNYRQAAWPERFIWNRRKEEWFMPSYMKSVIWYPDSEAAKQSEMIERVERGETAYKQKRDEARTKAILSQQQSQPHSIPKLPARVPASKLTQRSVTEDQITSDTTYWYWKPSDFESPRPQADSERPVAPVAPKAQEPTPPDALPEPQSTETHPPTTPAPPPAPSEWPPVWPAPPAPARRSSQKKS